MERIRTGVIMVVENRFNQNSGSQLKQTLYVEIC
jgi:hypothetical protein